MAAKDLFHEAVKQALIKEQWIITADPLKIKIEGVKLEIDLAAEKVFTVLLFSNEFIVFCVNANPKPENTFFYLYTQCSIVLSRTY